MNGATPELTVLALGGLLVLLQIFLASAAKTKELGTSWNLGPRDDTPKVGPRAERTDRALKNMLETFPVFVAAVAAVTLLGGHSHLTAACAWIWLGARVLYIPLYVGGVSPWRSVAWLVASAAIAVMLVAALL